MLAKTAHNIPHQYPLTLNKHNFNVNHDLDFRSPIYMSLKKKKNERLEQKTCPRIYIYICFSNITPSNRPVNE